MTVKAAKSLVDYIDGYGLGVPIDTFIMINKHMYNIKEISPLIITTDYPCEENDVDTDI